MEKKPDFDCAYPPSMWVFRERLFFFFHEAGTPGHAARADSVWFPTSVAEEQDAGPVTAVGHVLTLSTRSPDPGQFVYLGGRDSA